jgi:hypothetical protein
MAKVAGVSEATVRRILRSSLENSLGDCVWVCRQTGTSLEMIEKHCGKPKVVADELDSLIGEAAGRASERRNTALKKRNLPGTFEVDEKRSVDP